MDIFVPEIIVRKRDGKALRAEEISALIAGYARGDIPDYQMAALAMAVFFRGLEPEELAAWTDAMLHSGRVLVHEGVDVPIVDKHSTGGVGDKISLPLAPAVAACGAAVPMIAGRGLGHTGGTLDKLESIPGFQVQLPLDTACAQLRTEGLFIIGQTDEIAVADRRLYALRDVTGTVECIPLIASSIMSKKLAEGIDALVLDVKCGAGAFMTSRDQARRLARAMVNIGARRGTPVRAVLTDMDTPIGRTVGNALEVRESLEVLRGGGPEDTRALTVELGAHMLHASGAVSDLAHGRSQVAAALGDGRAMERFARMVAAQGGDPTVCERPDVLPTAASQTLVRAPRDGYVTAIDAKEVAHAALYAGAGRATMDDVVDPGAGVELHVAVGDPVRAGDPVATVWHDRDAGAAAARLAAAFTYGDTPGAPPNDRVLEVIS